MYSCVHDELSSSSDPTSKEYHSKSLWKEDETYIKNVMKVYNENEAQIKKVNGIPLWDYAMTMGYTDESFLVVPIANGKKIVSCIEVPRYGDQITFVYDNNKEHLKFFQGYTTAKKRKPVEQTREQSSMAGRLKLCSVTVVEMWYPDNENEPNGSGHWEVTGYITKCDEMQGGDGSSNPNPEGPTYPYPGGGGGNTNNNTNPCEKMKTQNSSQPFKDKVSELDKKEVFDKSQETGFAAAYGPQTSFEPLANTDNDNLIFPPGNKYFGYIHTHLDSKEGVVKIFSPADVSTFLTTCVRNAQVKGTMTDAYGMVITSQGNYILKYSGDGNYGIGPGTLKSWDSWYNKEYTKLLDKDGLSQANVEKLFAQFLEEKVKLDGLEVYKSDKTTGNTSKLKYDGKDKPVKPIPCP
ncbi:hypothetical protein B0A69_22035 [Chryseobacterium shigense]|nr:hypothetical protein B0A69_22035 [Chryseobacterium shigense]